MPGAREILQFVLTADAASAIRGFEEVEAAADKSLGAAETRMATFGSKATKLGAGGLVVSALALVGFAKLADLSSEATINLDKLKTAADHATQHIDIGQIQALNKELQKSTEFRADTLFGGEALFVNLGLTTEQIKTLTPLVADLAARFGISFDMASKLTVKAIDGSVSAFKRLTGLNLSSVDGQVGGFANTVKFLADTAGGFAEKQGATFAGQVVIMKNNLTSLGQETGKGAADAFQNVKKAAGDLAGELVNLNPHILESAGAVGTYSALGLAGASGLALVAGGVAKLTTALTDGEGALTGFGIAATGLVTVLGAVALYQGLSSAVNASSGVLDKQAGAIDNIRIAAAKANPDLATIGKNFANAALAQKDTVHFSSLWEEFGTRVQVSMKKAADGGKDMNQTFLDGQVSIEDAQRELNKLSPKNALLALDALQKTTNEITNNSGQQKDNQRFIDDNRKAIEKHAAAAEADAGATKGQGDASKLTTQQIKDQAAATQALETSIKNMQTPLDQWATAMSVLAAGGKAAAEGLDLSTQADDQIANAAKMGAAVTQFHDSVKDLPGTIDQTKLALGGYNDKQTTAIDNLTALAKENQDYVSGLISSGSSNDDVRTKAAALNDEYGKQLSALHLLPAQVAAYQQILGLTPDQVNTAIKLSGEAEAEKKLQLLAGEVAGLTGDQQREMRIHVEAGDAEGALSLLAIAQDKLHAKFASPIIAKIEAQADTDAANGDLDKSANKLRVAEIFAQADVDEANGEFDKAAAERRNAIILAQALGIDVANNELGNVAKPGGKDRPAPVTAVPNTKDAKSALDDLKAPIQPIITPQLKFNTAAFNASLESLLPPWLRPGGTAAPPAPAAPPSAVGPHVTASSPVSYVDQRRINITTNNPPGTPDTIKGIKRALKLNGDELRRALAVP